MKIDDSFQVRNKSVSEAGPKLINHVLHNSLVCFFYEYLLISYPKHDLYRKTQTWMIFPFPLPSIIFQSSIFKIFFILIVNFFFSGFDFCLSDRSLKLLPSPISQFTILQQKQPVWVKESPNVICLGI